ncbi:VCBS repeat-containing protein, partial [Streptomyces sp. ICN988]|nr:VCBS repeat-containing protein [Streptomyces sp. ICN988]
MIVRMDGSGDRVEASRRRLGRRSWVVGGGAVVVALAVAAGVVIADEEPARIAAPYGCGTGGAHAPAKAPQGAVDFDGDGRPDLALGSMGSVEGGAGGGSIEV